MLISIEGNIGSGKSTLLSFLKEHIESKNIIFLNEPVSQWEEIVDDNNTTMLEKFYADQKKYSFDFQMMAYISRLALLKEAKDNNPNAIIITERSLQTDKHVFAQMLYDSGLMEKTQFSIYLKWFEHFTDNYQIDKVIYVNANPYKCKERIVKRSRTGEDKISIDYLISCDKYHDKMIDLFPKEKVMTIDGNQNIEDDNNLMIQWINQIKKTIDNEFQSCN